MPNCQKNYFAIEIESMEMLSSYVLLCNSYIVNHHIGNYLNTFSTKLLTCSGNYNLFAFVSR